MFLTLLSAYTPTTLTAGNLSLIEKRLQELDRLNKKAIQQVGVIPKDGSISIEATVPPGATLARKTPGIKNQKFNFGKKEVLAVDQKRQYSVQISSSRSKKQCFRVAELMRKAGYPAFTASIKLKESGLWYRIFVGSYETKDKADAMRQELEKEEISDGFIRSMAYAIQVGNAGKTEELQPLRKTVYDLQYMPYTSYVRDTATSKTRTRLLVGAFTKKEHTAYLLQELRQAGLTAKVVIR